MTKNFINFALKSYNYEGELSSPNREEHRAAVQLS